MWVTAAASPRTFERAGAIGANLLTHLLDHNVDELAAKVSAYRGERAAHGHDPDAGQVTVMLHTFLGSDIASVHAIVREPYCRYLKENIHLLKGLAVHRGSQADVTRLSSADLTDLSASCTAPVFLHARTPRHGRVACTARRAPRRNRD